MKKFISTLFALLIAIIGITSVNASDSSITFYNRSLSGVTQIINVGTTYKEVQTSSGKKIAYCFNKKLDAPPSGSTLVATDNSILPNDKRTNQYIYILDNGYGGSWNTNVLGNANYTNDQKYYITQVALWIAQGEVNADTIKNSGTLGLAAYNLYKAAEKNSTVIAYTPEIIFSGNGNMKLAGNEYVSDAVTVIVKGSNNAKLSLANAPAGSKLLVNGERKDGEITVSSGTSFHIIVPASAVTNDLSVKVVANTTATRKKIQIYKYQNNNNYQNIGLIFEDNYTATKELTTKIAPKGTLVVEKIEIVDGKEQKLAGATLALFDSKGNQIKKWNTSDENPVIFTSLTIGETYTVKEENAPTGYKKIASVDVTIDSTEVKTIKVINTKSTSIKISKQDITNKKELEGATLVVKNESGEVIDTWVSKKEPHYITKELTPGKYYLTETNAPKGYQLSTEEVTFTVKGDGTVSGDVVMYNTPKKGVIISKQDVATSKELPGATLVVKDENGKVVDSWISTETPHYIENLAEGKYTLIETKSPKGYGLSDEVITFEVKYDGKAVEKVIMYNSIIPDTGDINVGLIIAGLLISVGLGIFGFTKLNKHA